VAVGPQLCMYLSPKRYVGQAVDQKGSQLGPRPEFPCSYLAWYLKLPQKLSIYHIQLHQYLSLTVGISSSNIATLLLLLYSSGNTLGDSNICFDIDFKTTFYLY